MLKFAIDLLKPIELVGDVIMTYDFLLFANIHFSKMHFLAGSNIEIYVVLPEMNDQDGPVARNLAF